MSPYNSDRSFKQDLDTAAKKAMSAVQAGSECIFIEAQIPQTK